jgi:hypothetical protein
MKRCTAVVLFLSVSLGLWAQKTLDQAIGETAAVLSAGFPENSRLVILNIEAPAEALSEYVVNNLSSALVGRLELVERSPAVMQRIMAEASYQRSGLVSEGTIVALGEQAGAQAAVAGNIIRAGELYVLTIRAVDIAGAQIKVLHTALVKPDAVLDALVLQNQNVVRPQWLDFPLEYGAKKYENQPAAPVTGSSLWYYDLGISNRTTTEQRARTWARENLQQNIAANIASDFSSSLDILELSAFWDSEVEDVQQAVTTAISASIQVRLPSFEVLEWHVDRGTENGRPWYIAYLLVRFPRQDIIKMVEAIDPAPLAREVLRALPEPSGDAGNVLIADLLEARTAIVETLR